MVKGTQDGEAKHFWEDKLPIEGDILRHAVEWLGWVHSREENQDMRNVSSILPLNGNC